MRSNCFFSVLGRFVVILAAAPAIAQHTELAANGDGSLLYVVSHSVLRDAATPTHAETRLYRIGPEGVQLFAQRETISTSTGWSSYFSSEGIAVPQVSDDGQTVAYTVRGVCISDPCVTGTIADVKGTTTVRLGQGTAQMSRNGRWAVLSSDYGPRTTSAELIDLSTGRHAPVPEPAITPFGIASDGSVLTSQAGLGLGLLRDGQFTPLSFAAETPLHAWALSDNARVFVYSELTLAMSYPGIQLKARDIVTGRDTVLFGSQEPLFMSMSNDGRLVLFRVLGTQFPNGPAFLADTNTGQVTRLALSDGELAAAGTLSGDGSVAFIATNSGRILKFHVANLASAPEVLIPATPDAGHGKQFPVGSLVRLTGYLPGSVDDLRGRILPIKLIKGDFSGLVTTQPQPGDIVIAYMTGLGPVQGQPQTAVPTPVDVLMPISGQITCTFLPQQTSPFQVVPRQSPAETLFAGLAPGLVGTYQVAFRMPANAGQGRIVGVSCQLMTPLGNGFLLVGL